MKWKVATNYKRAQEGKADIVTWEDQSKYIAKNIKLYDAEIIVTLANEHFEMESFKKIEEELKLNTKRREP